MDSSPSIRAKFPDFDQKPVWEQKKITAAYAKRERRRLREEANKLTGESNEVRSD